VGTDATYAFHSQACGGGVRHRSVPRVRHGLRPSAKEWRARARRLLGAAFSTRARTCQEVRQRTADKKKPPALTLAGMEYAVLYGLNGEPAVGIEPTTVPIGIRERAGDNRRRKGRASLRRSRLRPRYRSFGCTKRQSKGNRLAFEPRRYVERWPRLAPDGACTTPQRPPSNSLTSYRGSQRLVARRVCRYLRTGGAKRASPPRRPQFLTETTTHTTMTEPHHDGPQDR